MTADEDVDVRDAPMGELGRSVRTALTNHHAIGERTGPIRAGNELRPRRGEGLVALGNIVKGVPEGPRDRPPELVRVVVDHPIGVELGGGEPGHMSDPVGLPLVVVVRMLLYQVQETGSRILT